MKNLKMRKVLITGTSKKKSHNELSNVLKTHLAIIRLAYAPGASAVSWTGFSLFEPISNFVSQLVTSVVSRCIRFRRQPNCIIQYVLSYVCDKGHIIYNSQHGYRTA